MGKYADITRLFGWDVLKDFFRQEHLNKIDGISTPMWDSDDRTYRLSLKAGVDLTPLIEFWGIHPVNPKALRERMQNSDLFLSDQVKELLNRYLTIIPNDNSEFRKHYNDVWPNVKPWRCRSTLYGCGWYNKYVNIWQEKHHKKAVRAGQAIINKYWSSAVPSNKPSTVPSIKPSSRPSTLPSILPSLSPSSMPSFLPSVVTSSLPTAIPSSLPSDLPSSIPSTLPSLIPTSLPSVTPSVNPSVNPSVVPSSQPSSVPSTVPSLLPSTIPSFSSTKPTYFPKIFPVEKRESAASLSPSTISSFMLCCLSGIILF